MVEKWLPQDDILAHPNVRLFISHCGKGSVTESKYHGVPILGMPIFGDQLKNIEQVVEEGWGLEMKYTDLSEERLTKSINELFRNKSYSNVVQTSAQLFKDRPQHPLDTAVYWVEYVLRHNGAKHMQSQAVHMNWFQYHGLDIYGFIFAVLYVTFKVTKCTLKFLFGKCFGKSKPKKD